ncbi:GroES-like protein [Tothia fuscella]|uniref:GroES-like protein n=1 Tax=Tothia fuscella TaxID=1048955 RepID=A0A9P4NFL4_9PEZI|nr:GroES-like protein [Tothia fuscella]
MKGIAVEKVGAPLLVVDNIENPEPADDQILVKSIYTAINPVDGFMAFTGLLITKWPFILGCDAGGVVVKAGSKAEGPLGPFKVGDEVCGCTRLGMPGYSTCQEYFLMDAALATPKPKTITLPQAATVGVGFYASSVLALSIRITNTIIQTACLAVFNGFHIEIPDATTLPAPANGEWAVVLGGASSVGKFAIQLLKALGYQVAATCSAKSSSGLEAIGLDVAIDYKKPEEEQIAELLSKTDGKATRIFDAVAQNDPTLAKAVFKQIDSTSKYFSTTNDWSRVPQPESDFSGGKHYATKLGPIGRDGADELNGQISRFIPIIVKLMENGKVVPAEYEVIGETGFESALEAFAYQQKGSGGSKKVLVKLQEE